MPWSSVAQSVAVARSHTHLFLPSLKDITIPRLLMGTGALCLFALVAVRSFVSVSESLLASPGETVEMSRFASSASPLFAFSDTGKSAQDSVKHDSSSAPVTVPDTLQSKRDTAGTLPAGIPPERNDTTQPGDESPADSLSDGEQAQEDTTEFYGDTTETGEGAVVEEPTEDELESDSLAITADTLHKDSTKTDSTYVVFLDSTWRMQQHVHHRSDDVAVRAFPRSKQSLYLPVSSPAYQREVKLDTTGRFVLVRETVNGLDVKVPVKMPLDEYVSQRIEYEERNNWRTMTHQYNLNQREDGLANLFSSFTKIEIPVPPNPIFSIFGKNKISLHITGSVDIRAGFKNITSDVQTLSSLDQSRNEPDFNQDVSITVDGSVGDKLKIGADWNTQRTFEYENSLKIRYDGYEDEIIKTVEAGNVSLSVPSFVGSSQALFGIKTQMQFGPLSLTALVSQKKGSSKEVTISGGSKTSGTDIAVTKYSRSHYFLDVAYRSVFELFHKSLPSQYYQDLAINEIEVWKSVKTQQVTGRREVRAYYNLPSRTSKSELYDEATLAALDADSSSGVREIAGFVRLEPGKDYKVHKEEGYISLNSAPAEEEVIAVAYATDGGDYIGEFAGVGSSDTSRPLILKLIKPQYLRENMKAWDLMLKNIYFLGARDIKESGLDLKIMYKPIGESESEEVNGLRLLTMLRLDRYQSGSGAGADNKFDFIPGFTIDPERGELIFPDLRPFDSTLAQEFRGKNFFAYDSLLISSIYDKKLTTLEENSTENNILAIRPSIAGAVSARISLNAFNIVEGSVQVLFNGSPLTPGVDYDVNYMIGEVNIRKEEALVPGANVQIKYEQNDMFQIASKTLMGARGELYVGRDSRLGFTLMNLNQETLSDKVRLGEEPTNNTILGVDGSTQYNLPFLTSALDAIPGLQARDMSSIKFSGEAAYILPDPNTKRSTILSDNGASIAYIDDFEGTRRIVPLNVSYTAWKPASPPEYTLIPNSPTDEIKTFSKGKLIWYNNTQRVEPVSVHEIWPFKSVRRGEELVPLLIMEYNPRLRGMYNYSLNTDSTMLLYPERNWNGIQRYIASTAGDLVQQNLNYLELWVKATSDDSLDLRRGSLFIDIGKVSEDVIPDGKLNSEDIIKTSLNPGGIPNGIYNQGEDLGLDMINNDEERAKYAELISRYPDLAGDPSGDDFSYTTESSNFDHLNGVEGNNERNAVDSRLPDTEDLNSNSNTDYPNNRYIEYQIPLAESLESGEANQFIVGGGTNKWYQIRIPLLDTTRVSGGDPAINILQNVQYIRLWLSGFTKPVKLRIAEVNFVGSQWVEGLKDDSVMKASVVNVEDNPNYTIPPGVIRERDRTQPDQEIYGNEQSLSLLIKGLQAGQSRQVIKYMGQRAVDMFSYRALKLFVHGDPTFGEDAEVFIRFGADTVNYYEYSQPLKSDWDEMNIVFNELTSVKAARDSGASTSKIPAPSGPEGSYYSIRGNPALTKVQYIGIGVRNISGDYPFKTRYTTPPRDLEGEVWINEMRVVDVDNTAGGAYRFDTQLKLSDFGNVSVNYSYTDPNFHGVDRAFGDRITRKSWAVNTNFSLDNFLPQDWQGASIPFAYSHSENIALPKYLTNTDVVVDEAARRASDRLVNGTEEEKQRAGQAIIDQSQTVSVRDNYTISNLKFGLPWQAWYVRDIINSLSFRFNYSSSSDRDPAIISKTSWLWTFGMSYSVNLNHGLFVQPFSSLLEDIPILDDYKDWKIYLFPIMNISTSLDGSRSRSYELSRSVNATARETRGFSANKQLSFGWKLTEGGLLGIGGDYGITLRRDLLYLDTTGNRGFSQILHALFIGGRDGSYGQSVNFNTRPKIPNILDITKYIDQVSASYRVNYGWQNAFLRGDAGKSAQWDNSIGAGFNFRLKALADTWFKDDEQTTRAPKPKPQRVPPRQAQPGNDSTKSTVGDTTAIEDTSEAFDALGKLKNIARIAIKYPLLDYESINISFQQSNRSTNTGVVGGTGFKNFWGVLPFQNPDVGINGGGPSRLYQLGLVSDPSSTLRFKSQFPFFERYSYRGAEGWLPNTRGIRATGAQPTDAFMQKNDISLKTNRPLWEGATLGIEWKVGWQYNSRTTLTIDTLTGLPLSGLTQVNGSVERSYMSLPPVLLFKVFKSSLEDVGKKYDENIKKEEYADRKGEAAADAFERGMEAMPFLNKVLGQFVPRANWNLRWSGIERLAGISEWVQSLSLEHNYRSSFRRDFHFDKNGAEQTDVERISYDFAPLIGVNTQFKELLKGNFNGSFQYKTSTSYDLSLTNQRITEDLTREISISLTYSRRGFEFPLFGLNLKNDLEFTFNYSTAKKSRRQHDPTFLQSNQEGTPLDGNIRTTMEPRIRYTLSSRVTAALFYRYSRTEPDEGGSTIPGTTTNEAGVDIHISIQ